MRLLKDISPEEIFYYGTIVIIKNAHITPTGTYDGKYAMVGNSGVNGFRMMDLSRSMGSCIWHDLEINETNEVPGYFGVTKQGIYNWVKQYFEHFYTKEGQEDFIPRLEEIVYVDDLDQHFVQSNRNLFMGKPEEDGTKRAANADTYNAELAGETFNLEEFQEPERSMLKSFQKYLDETPQEELEKTWKEVENMNIKGPTVEEYFNSLNPNYMYHKGYTEGATKFKELVEAKLHDELGESEERMLNRILKIFKEVFDNN